MGLGAFYHRIECHFSQRPSPDGGANRFPVVRGSISVLLPRHRSSLRPHFQGVAVLSLAYVQR